MPEEYSKEARRGFAAAFIGRRAEVVALGAVVPHEGPAVARHLPLPEYGVALVIREDPAPCPARAALRRLVDEVWVAVKDADCCILTNRLHDALDDAEAALNPGPVLRHTP